MATEHRTEFKQPMKRGLNDGPFIDKTRCDGVLVGGARCRKTNGVESCLCGCTLNLCPECMGSSSKASSADWNRIDAVTGTPLPVPAPPTRTEEPETLSEQELAFLRFARTAALPFDVSDKAEKRLRFLEPELARLREQIQTMRDAIETLLKSAHPHPTEHPSMYEAHAKARTVLSAFPPERP